MRFLFLDLDTLRPDHLGCYGYHRNTSPNIDRIASQGVRFDEYHVPDAPCLPARAALISGMFIFILRVRFVERSTCVGITSDLEGTRRTSSKERPTLILSDMIFTPPVCEFDYSNSFKRD